MHRQYRSRSLQHCLAVLLLGVSLACTGCNAAGLGQQDQLTTDKLASLIYPSQSNRGGDLDILVVRTAGSIKLVNRTPRVYHNVELWLNQQYVNIIPKLEISQSSGGKHMSLPTFINKHGQAYAVGGLLTPELNQPLLIAEIFDPATGLRHHLLVQQR